MATEKQIRDFVARFGAHAQQWSQQTGIPASVYLAILASESNYGAAESFFGIKGGGDAGTVAYRTHEVRPDGSIEYITDNFAKYSSPDAGHQAFLNLISQGRYAKAWEQYQQTGDWQGLLKGINQAGYATDPTWYSKIASISNQFTDLDTGVTPAGLQKPQVGPAGRSFAEIRGTEYLSEDERTWYKAMERGDTAAANAVTGTTSEAPAENTAWGVPDTVGKNKPATTTQQGSAEGGDEVTNENLGQLPPGARVIGGNLAVWKDENGTTFYFQYNPNGYVDPNTFQYIPAGWNPRGTPNEADKPSATELREQQAAAAAADAQATYRTQLNAVANNKSDQPLQDQHGQLMSLSKDPTTGAPSIMGTSREGAAQLGTPGISRPGNSEGRPQRITVLDDYAKSKAGMSFQELAQRDSTAAYKLRQEFLAQDAWSQDDVANYEAAESLMAEGVAAEEKRRRAQADADAYYQQKSKEPMYQAQGAVNVAGATEQDRRLQASHETAFPGQTDVSRGAEAAPIFLNNDMTGTPPPDMSFLKRMVELQEMVAPGTGWMVYRKHNGTKHRYGGHTYEFYNGDWRLADPEGYNPAVVEEQRLRAATPHRDSASGNALAMGGGPGAAGGIDNPSWPTLPLAQPPAPPPGPAPIEEEPYRPPPQVMAGGGYGTAGAWMPKIMYANGGGFMTGNPIGMFEMDPTASRIVNPTPRAIAGEDANGDGIPEQEAITVVNQQQLAGRQPLAPGVGDIFRGVRPNMDLAQRYAMDPALMQIAAQQMRKVKYRPAMAA